MKTLFAVVLATLPMSEPTRCLTFTDGERIFDFEFEDEARIYEEPCKVLCQEGQCTFYCPTHVTSVLDTNPPTAINEVTGKVTILEPLCQ